ncbi:MAG: hypothetical protein JJU02_15875 [Cryomorphaceae bacterium]|nr:hypothetical protein [Cryomorphaceae bacterium]
MNAFNSKDLCLNINYKSIVFKKDYCVGMVYFNLNEFNFPDNQWNDRIDVLLRWWTEAAKSEETIILNFMDGPFCLKLDIPCNLVFFYKSEKLLLRKSFNSQLFLDNLMCETKRFLAFCASQNFESKELVDLKSELLG